MGELTPDREGERRQERLEQSSKQTSFKDIAIAALVIFWLGFAAMWLME